MNITCGWTWVPEDTRSSGTQVQPQVILDPDYLPDYLSVSYDYGSTKGAALQKEPHKHPDKVIKFVF